MAQAYGSVRGSLAPPSRDGQPHVILKRWPLSFRATGTCAPELSGKRLTCRAEPQHCGQQRRPRLRGRPPLRGARERRRAAPLGPRKRGGPEGERFVRPGRRFSDPGARRRRPHHGRRPKRPRQPRRRPLRPRDLAPDRHAGSFRGGRRGSSKFGGSDRDRSNRKSLRAEGKARAVFVPKKDPPAHASTLLGDSSRPTYGKRTGSSWIARRTWRRSPAGRPVADSSIFRGRHYVERPRRKPQSRREGARGPRPRSAPGATKAREERAGVTARRLLYRESEVERGLRGRRDLTRGTGAPRVTGERVLRKERKLERWSSPGA